MKRMMALFLTLALASALSACGNNEPSAASDKNSGDKAVAADEELVIHATNYKFDKEEYHLTKGKTVKITFKSQGMHGLAIKELGVNLKRNNASKTVTLDKPGTYEIKCSIVCGSGHKDMVSKLIVS
ncbi:cupredoxin domain-containing protein [Gorillibacterium massiliense]|uniref:cupredoxin domain-containing protein n=1 Tax=Gorillibacterium massiliense TaxID=1280390 RepID=UPI0004AF8F32|nr:cupredoxin domain-containing protein [Gorillibacterium massiliense]